jgi:predicted membrane protein
MKNRISLLIGSGLIGIGLISIIDSIFHINLWALFFPLLIIAFGIFIIIRPSKISEKTEFIFKFIGEITRDGYWQVSAQEIWCFVGDMTFDFRHADIPEGVSEIKILNFVSDIDIYKPENGVLQVTNHSFVSDTKSNGQKRDLFLTPFHYQDPEFAESNHKVVLDIWSFVGGIKII